MRRIWQLIRNEPIDCGDEGPWQVSRRERFEIMKPRWAYTLFVQKAECGCAWRFGWKKWRVLWCVDHIFGPRSL